MLRASDFKLTTMAIDPGLDEAATASATNETAASNSGDLDAVATAATSTMNKSSGVALPAGARPTMTKVPIKPSHPNSSICQDEVNLPAYGVETAFQEELQRQMETELDRWGMDIFGLHKITQQRPLTAVAYAIFEVSRRWRVSETRRSMTVSRQANPKMRLSLLSLSCTRSREPLVLGRPCGLRPVSLSDGQLSDMRDKRGCV